MIIYFTGTRNSRYAAKAIQSVTGDAIVSMNDLIKVGNKSALRSDRPFVFVCPTYAGRMPRIVNEFIKGTQLEGSDKAYFVLTCCGNTGTAPKYISKLCDTKHLKFMGMSSINMPQNYITWYAPPDHKEAQKIIQTATPTIIDVAKVIQNGELLKDNRPTPGFNARSDLGQPIVLQVICKR